MIIKNDKLMQFFMVKMNNDLSKILLKISDLYVLLNDDNRARAYKRASHSLKSCKETIKSGDQAKKLNDIGTSIGEKIDEFIQTGHITKIDELESLLNQKEDPVEQEPIINNTEKDVCNLFMTISGVGPVTSKKWYDQGYRCLEDLSKVKLNKRQQIGLKYYKDLQERIPRSEIDTFNTKLDDILDGIDFMICGSYRRGLESSQDVDLLVKNTKKSTIDKVVNILKKHKLIIDDLVKGQSKYSGIVQLDKARQLDILVIDKESWHYSTLYFTGSFELNIKMRDIARDKDLRLNEYELHDEKGKSFKVESEREIFELLDMDYLEPNQRNI